MENRNLNWKPMKMKQNSQALFWATRDLEWFCRILLDYWSIRAWFIHSIPYGSGIHSSLRTEALAVGVKWLGEEQNAWRWTSSTTKHVEWIGAELNKDRTLTVSLLFLLISLPDIRKLVCEHMRRYEVKILRFVTLKLLECNSTSCWRGSTAVRK